MQKLKKTANSVDHQENISSGDELFAAAFGVPAVGKHSAASQSGKQDPSGFFREIKGFAPPFQMPLLDKTLY